MRVLILMALPALASGCAYGLRTASNTERAAVVYRVGKQDAPQPGATAAQELPPDYVEMAQKEWMLRAACLQTGADGKVTTMADCTPSAQSPQSLWQEAEAEAARAAYLEASYSATRFVPKVQGCLEFTGPGAATQSLDLSPKVVLSAADTEAKGQAADVSKRGANGGAAARFGTIDISMDTNYAEQYAQVYTVSEILLYGHAMSFRLCEARRNGDITTPEYVASMATLQDSIDKQIRYVLETDRDAQKAKAALVLAEITNQKKETTEKTEDEVKNLASSGVTDPTKAAELESIGTKALRGEELTDREKALLGEPKIQTIEKVRSRSIEQIQDLEKREELLEDELRR